MEGNEFGSGVLDLSSSWRMLRFVYYCRWYEHNRALWLAHTELESEWKWSLCLSPFTIQAVSC